MEHVVQFGIGIDDELIRKRVEEAAEKEIIKQLSDAMARELFGRDCYGRPDRSNVAGWVHAKVDEFMTANKDEIIACAAERLADKVSKTKAFREAVGKAGENGYA